MKKIDFYRGIDKTILISGPAIVPNQHYKCVVFKDLDSISTGVISCIAQAIQPTGCPCATVEFVFEKSQTATLNLGDNNLCVYDVIPEESESSSSSSSESETPTGETEYTLYKVYEAKVYASESYPNKAGE